MRPFLFLGTRAEDVAADGEYDAVLRFSGLEESQCRRVRLERDSLTDVLGEVDLDDWSGVILGGGPFNVSDPEERKSPAQLRAEAELRALALQVVSTDTAFLGCCYGIGTLGSLLGGMVDRTYGEPIGAVPITLTDQGAEDPLLGVLPPTFDAFLGHKEAVHTLPRGAVRADFHVGEATVRVIGMHLDLSGLRRRQQIRTVLNHLADSDGDPPAVLMGDFNQWGDRSGAMQEFEGPWHVCQTGPTFPTRRPIACLDRIVISPEWHCRSTHVHLSELSLQASDHLPIVAEIELV